MPRTFAGKLWVGGTSFLIAFISYSSQFFIIWPWYGHTLSTEFLLLVGPFNVLVALLYWSYSLCVRTNPGVVPKDWQPDFQSSQGYEIKRETGRPRYCRTCEKFKPPRAHHCRQCKRCVLRMDHHCPWVDNCVGYYNYPYFIRFLFFVDITCAYHLAMVISRVRDSFVNQYWVEPSSIELVFIVLNFVACVPVMILVGLFSLYHFYCVLTNTTTIEGWEKSKVATLIRRGKIHEVKFPYDLGAIQNLYSILGKNPLTWCWPTTIPIGDGLKYPVGEGNDPFSQQLWPPRDPYKYDDDQATSIKHRIDGYSPWTFGDGLNPDLLPSSSRLLRERRSKAISVAPYHPDYSRDVDVTNSDGKSTDQEPSSSEEEETYRSESGKKLRRGSEGVEVFQEGPDEILRRYIATRGEDAIQIYP